MGQGKKEIFNDVGNAGHPEKANPHTFWFIKDGELVSEIVLWDKKQGHQLARQG